MSATDFRTEMFWELMVEDLEGDPEVYGFERLDEAMKEFDKLANAKNVGMVQLIEHTHRTRSISHWVRQ